MRAAQITKPGIVETVDLNTQSYKDYSQRLINPPPGWLTVQVAASGICGTDQHIFKGEYIGSYPLIPGHEFSGTITAVGDDVSTVQIGDRVAIEPNISCGICATCMENRQHFCKDWKGIGVTLSGGMASHVSVPQQAVFSIGDLDFQAAAFMEPLSCVLHGIERLQPRLADRVALIGAGPIGILLLRTLQSAGVGSVDVIERHQERAAFAERCGATQVHGDIAAVTGGEYDAVIDATGVPVVLEQTIQMVRPSGKILFFGVPPKDAKISITPFTLFQRELSILSSFTSLRNSRQAIDMIQHGRIKVDDLVSHVVALEGLEGALQLLQEAREPVMKVMIDPQLG